MEKLFSFSFESTLKNTYIPHSVNILLFFLCCIGLLTAGCNEKLGAETTDTFLTPTFKKIDSIHKAGDHAQAYKILDSVKPLISPLDIKNLTNYYTYKGYSTPADSNLLANSYADSLLIVFERNEKYKTQYRQEYISALLLKGNFLALAKQYEKALEYYFKIRSMLDAEKDPVNYSDYCGKIAFMYYHQGLYEIAARYQLEAYQAISKANNVKPSSLFYMVQGALNNGGFSYECAGILDSALYLYQKNIHYIEDGQHIGKIDSALIKNAKIVAYDNLGGLYFKMGDYDLAQQSLEKSIAINNYETEPIKLTAYIKLAQVYTQIGKLAEADMLLDRAYSVIHIDKQNIYKHKQRYYRAKSELYLKKKRYQEALYFLREHTALADTIQILNREFHKVNIHQQFQQFKNNEEVKKLEKANENKSLYLTGALLFLAMLIVIILLILKNARQARKAEIVSVKQNKKLEKAMERLENRNRDYAKMMKVMAHDLKNPIGGMVGISNYMVEEDRFSKEDKEMLQLIAASGENSIEMINQLLNSGLAIENEQLFKEKLDIQQLLRQCCELLQYRADEKQQKILFISGGPVFLYISKEKIWRVLNNLIVNAIKFSPQDSTIKVILERQQKSVLISVIDHGIGVPQKDKKKIFEMFTSAKRSGTAGEQPFGIGLSVSKQIIESHQGKIWLDDNPGGGTIFYVELPV